MLIVLQNSNAQSLHTVYVKGAMKDAMWKGEIYGKIAIDTISGQEHLYGIGPVENISGEILVLHGKAYSSRVISKTKMKVEEGNELKAPFFVYAIVQEWEEIELPANVRAQSDLENFLHQLKINQPFAFRIEGFVDTANIHVVNLPAGKKVSSPDEAHEGKTSFDVFNKLSEIIGFFSTKHQGIFTHHDSYLHMHFAAAGYRRTGRCDREGHCTAL